MIKAVIFDMDGLLIDSEPLWKRVHAKVFKEVGVEFTPELHVGMLGKRTPDAVAHVYRQHPWQGSSVDDVAAKVDQEIIRLMKREIVLRPGAHQALQTCKKAGLPVAIASSSNPAVIAAAIDTLELREHFDHIYSARFEEYGKPHPAVFLKVAEHFKVTPQDCLVFEDSPAGVIAAKAAQMRCIAVPEADTKGHPFLGTADEVLDSLEEFDAAMLKRLGR